MTETRSRAGTSTSASTSSWAAARGLPAERHGDRLRRLCEASGLGRDDRIALLDVVAHRNAPGYETHRQLGGVE